MTKQQKKSTTPKSADAGFKFSKYVPEKYQTPALLILLLILILIFFSPVMFGDKTTSSGDLIQVKSLREYATKDRDGFSLWNPYIFCGMPAVATSMSLRWFDLTADVYSYASKIYSAFFHDYNAIYTFSFVILAFTAFFFMRSFGAGRGISFLVSVATIFSTGIVLLFYIGHITKLMSLAVFPFILMMLFKFQKKITWLDFALFLLGMHLLVLGAHVQIVFYFILVTIIYFIYFFVRSFITKDNALQKQLLKSLGIVALAGLIAFLMSFDTYAQLYEYKPYSTRGTKSVTELKETGAESPNNAYEYATNWSYSPGEILTFIVPSYYGFGKSTYNGPLTQNQDYEVNTYFGQMTSVDVAMYMGIIIFALGIFTLIVRWRDPIVQFFGIVVVLFLLLSFGRTLPFLYNLFYYHFPGFDNFRSPSMTLHIIQIIFPILAGFGIMKIISLRDEKNAKTEKIFKYTAMTFAGLFVLFFLLSGSIGSWFTQRVSDYAASLGQSQRAQQEAQTFNALAEYMTDMFKGDLLASFALLALTFGLIYAFIKLKLNKELFIAGIAVLVLFDLFRVSHRGASYVDSEKVNDLFREPNYISVIKQQNDKEPHRILNLKQDGSLGSFSSNANFNVYFLQEDFYGYSAVKPRSYQDIMDVVGPVNPTLWRMLGVKYVVTDRPYNPDGFANIYQGKDEFVYRNEKALPRIYFVDSVAQKSGVDMLNAIKNNSFDPKKLAFVEKLDFKFDKGDSTNSAQIISYKDESLAADVNCKSSNFLFFGTTYLPGWKAFIDNSPATIYKADYGFQGIVVPQGKHKVKFVYEPGGFVAGKYLSLILNVMMFGGLGYMLFLSTKKKAPGKK
ncbi:MAG: YfhO family protein [Bacteroidetes bacterium]|nr:YfhO family protein [Bacteroidota bacterium]